MTTTQAGGPGGSPLIMLVEDCRDNLDMYSTYLGRRGMRVVEASEGREAIERASTLLPDLVVMDLTLPDMDGTQAIAAIRRDPRTRATPIIVVSGYAPPENGVPVSWDAYLSKPCPPDKLFERIRGLLDRPAS